MNIEVRKSNRSDKKFDAIINGKQKVSFGRAGSSDYTKHKNEARKDNYNSRHSNEDWSKSNVASPAWMSRFILWENPRLKVQLPMLTRSARMSISN